MPCSVQLLRPAPLKSLSETLCTARKDAAYGAAHAVCMRCDRPMQCCTGICRAGRCAAPASGCRGTGPPCNENTAASVCCSGNCIHGKCVCDPDGYPCTKEAPHICCSGFCGADGTCGCAPAGRSCTASYVKCCSGFCGADGKCPDCLRTGRSCSVLAPDQCCSGFCHPYYNMCTPPCALNDATGCTQSSE